MAAAERDNEKMLECTAFLRQHQISAVLETCIGAVLSAADSGNLVSALADEVPPTPANIRVEWRMRNLGRRGSLDIR